MRKRIVVEVSGPAGSGKSGVVGTLAAALTAAGVPFSIDDPEQETTVLMGRAPAVLNSIRDRVEVKIIEGRTDLIEPKISAEVLDNIVRAYCHAKQLVSLLSDNATFSVVTKSHAVQKVVEDHLRPHLSPEVPVQFMLWANLKLEEVRGKRRIGMVVTPGVTLSPTIRSAFRKSTATAGRELYEAIKMTRHIICADAPLTEYDDDDNDD